MSCNICIENFNKSTRLEIVCSFCDYSNCRTCFQKYLLETPEPYCMSCKKIFTQDFLFEKCTSTFLNKELKKHREVVLLNQQKSYLPATQPYVMIEKERDNMRLGIIELEKEKNAILETLHAKQNQINNLQYRISNIRYNETDEQTDRKKFIRKCPITDCRGFLSQQWKCGTCDAKICNKCNEEKIDTEEHVCDPGNVANMELINKDTKPCPECGTMIFKISGCQQMFCTGCHCAWNWNTGLVEKGVIHNPHYYEFIRRGGGNGGRNHADIPCGGLPHVNELRIVINYAMTHSIINSQNSTKLYNIHNVVTHLQHYEIRNVANFDETGTRDLRIMYMLQKITEDDFKKTLQQLEKQKNKKRDFNNIYQMFVDVCSDIFRQIIVFYNNHKFEIENMKTYLNEQFVIFENLKNYFNENIKICGKGYKCVYPGISENFGFEYNYERYLAIIKRSEEIKQERLNLRV